MNLRNLIGRMGLNERRARGVERGRQMNWTRRLKAPGIRGWLGLWLLLAGLVAGWAAEPLEWQPAANRLTAQINGWPLERLLTRIAVVMGWEVYVEPGAERTVSAQFHNLPLFEALPLLFGDLDFSLQSRTNAPSRFLVYRTNAQQATQRILPPASAPVRAAKGARLANERVVTLKPGSREGIEALAQRLGGKIVGRADSRQTYRLLFDNEEAANAAAALLNANPDVASVDDNYRVEGPPRVEAVTLNGPVPPGIQLKPADTGKQFVVGLLDTAVQPQGSGLSPFLLPSMSVAGQSEPASGQPTHGTTMAETLLQAMSTVAGETASTTVRILPVDVYGPHDTTTTFDVANGIVQAVNAGAKVINLSLGGDGDSTYLHQIVQAAAQQGIVFIAAAGNNPVSTPTYPAAYPEVVAVTAGGRNGLAAYANRGDFVDAVAPGTSLITFQNQAYMVTGTSASTASFTGWLAGQVESSGKSPGEVKQDLLKLFPFKAAGKAP